MRKPKPIPLMLKPWPDPEPNRLYRGQIKEISETKKAISVTIKTLDKTLAGCLQYVDLSKDLHPGNKTHRFVLAAGFEINTVGVQIDDLRQAIGRIVGMRFVPSADGYEIGFEKVTTKAKTQTTTKTGSSDASDTEALGDLEHASDSEDDVLSI